MRTRVPYALAVVGLLLVGAGCAGGVAEKAAVNPVPGAPAAMKAETPKSEIDTSVDTLLKAGDDEKAAQADREQKVDDVNADKASVNAYGESSYELK